MRKQGGHVLHNLSHVLTPLFLSSVFLYFYPNNSPFDVMAVALFAGLLPDLDHINIWLEYRFRNFADFLRFVKGARRYRFSFLIFHNLASVTIVFLLIPIVNAVSPIGSLFLTAFLCHLMLDFFDDKLSIGRVTHWRYRRKT